MDLVDCIVMDVDVDMLPAWLEGVVWIFAKEET
jgi:hypothetical protein